MELSEYEKGVVKWLRRTRPTVYTICNHTSTSGMFRLISVFVIKGGVPININGLVAKMAGYGFDKRRQGLRVSGCGMDMGFSVVYSFSAAVFPKGFPYRKNEHHRNGDPSLRDRDGGYALRQQWL